MKYSIVNNLDFYCLVTIKRQAKFCNGNQLVTAQLFLKNRSIRKFPNAEALIIRYTVRPYCTVARGCRTIFVLGPCCVVKTLNTII